MPAISSSSEPPAPAPSRIRLSIAGVTGSPVSCGRVPGLGQRGQRAVGIQSVRPSGSPLSNTDESRLEACATRTAGTGQARARAGSLRRVTGTLASSLADPGAAAGPG